MKTELAEGEPGPDADSVGRIAAAPGGPVADEQAARSPSIPPVDRFQANETNMTIGLVQNRPDEIRSAPAFDVLEKLLLLDGGDALASISRVRPW